MLIFNTEIINQIFYKLSDITDIYKLIKLNKRFLQCYRNIDVINFCNKAKNKQEQLKIFISYYEYLPKQGSIEWVLYRQGSDLLPPVIGGSEIKNLIKTPKTVAKHKLKIDNFNGNIHTRWGNIFEEIFGQIVDSIFYTSSKETGSIPGLRNNLGQIVQSYSPDRLLVTSTNRLINVLLNSANGAVPNFAERLLSYQQNLLAKKQEHVIILCEFKCPSMRIPNGYIPDEYTLQPPVGLATIPIADIAIFANNSIRKCKVSDFNLTNNYDLKFHGGDLEKHQKDPKTKFYEPKFMGFVGVYKKSMKPCATNYESIPETITKQKLWLLLDQHMKSEVENVNSCYYLTEMLSLNVASLTTICLEFAIKNNYNDNIISEYLIDKLKPSDTVLFAGIIQDIINLYYKKNNIKMPFYGEDFGNYDNNQFEAVAKDIVDNRFNVNGYKAYYEAGILVNKSVADGFNISDGNIAKNHIDCQIWLRNQINKFINYCRENNYDIVGIIPYKMFKISMIPVFKEENFIDQYKDMIIEFTDMIQDIKQQGRDKKIPTYELSSFYSKCLDEYYGPSKRTTKKEFIKYEPDTIKFDQETIDEYNSL